MRKREKVTITLELSEEEAIYLSTNCIQRVVNSALKALPDDYEYMMDIVELGERLEPLRNRITNEIFKVRHAAGR